MTEIRSIADQLFECRQDIKALEEKHREVMVPLENRENDLERALMEQFKGTGIRTIKLDSGHVFALSTRFSLKVLDEARALLWAKKKKVVKVDTVAALKLLRDPKAPSPEDHGMTIAFTDYLSVRKGEE